MTIDFHGLPARSLQNDHLRLDYLAEAGPRLIRLRLAGSTDNLLAEAPNVHWPTPFGEYFLRGGHRLTLAPEALELSYVPDDTGLALEDLPQGVRLSGPLEAASGVSKSIEIQLHPDRPALTLRHALHNRRAEPIAIAAWAITLLPPGGLAVAPLRTSAVFNRHQPDRQVSLWPYSSWQDRRLSIDDDYVWIDAQPNLSEFKLGLLTRGWVGYLRSDVFFLKRFDPRLECPHPDLNTNTQVYCNSHYIELETLAPLSVLEPDQCSVHVETWEIYRAVDVPHSIEGLSNLIRSLHL